VLERTSDGVTSNSNETAFQISSTSQAFTTEPWGLRSRSPRWPTAIVLSCYAALAVFLTWSWWSPLGTRVTAINGSDMTLFSWLLNWTPHTLLTGQFPLFSDKLNAPTGINLMWNNGMALPGLLFARVTVLFGGLFTVTVLTTIGLAGSAATAYWCLRSMAVRALPAALGGLLFGFSPAMMAQALGHPDLVCNVLVPVLILLAVRIMISENPRLELAVLLGVSSLHPRYVRQSRSRPPKSTQKHRSSDDHPRQNPGASVGAEISGHFCVNADPAVRPRVCEYRCLSLSCGYMPMCIGLRGLVTSLPLTAR
jgi:hypothetical protein